MSAPVVLLVGFVLLLAGFVLVFWDKRVGARRSGFRHWERVPGRVTAARAVIVGEGTSRGGDVNTLWTAEIAYAYDVDGKTFEGAQRRFAGLDAGDVDHAERMVAAYPVGAAVEVAVDPEDPARSVIGSEPPNRALFGVGLVLIAIGGFVLMSR